MAKSSRNQSIKEEIENYSSDLPLRNPTILKEYTNTFNNNPISSSDDLFAITTQRLWHFTGIYFAAGVVYALLLTTIYFLLKL